MRRLPPRRSAPRAGAVALAVSLALAATPRASAAEPGLRLDPTHRDLVAVALSTVDQAAAHATEREVHRAERPGGPSRRVFRGRGIRDLVFDDAGSLWIATERGVHLVRPGQMAVERSPGPGGARHASRFARAADGRLAVATAGGVFLRDPAAELWRSIDGRTAAGSVTALGFDGAGGIGWVSEGDLYEGLLKSSSPQGNVMVPRRSPVPVLGDPVVDLARAPDGSWIALTARHLLRRRPGEREAWDAFALGLRPGAEARRIAFTRDTAWLATDGGLASLRWGPTGPDRAGSLPVRSHGRELGASPVNALAGRGEALLVATQRGLGIRGAAPAREPDAPGPRSRVPAAAAVDPVAFDDPALRDVQLAALRHLSLGTGSLRELAARARARGWLPAFELRGAYGGARRRDRDRDLDETFSFGEPRLYTDLEHRRMRSRDFDVAAVLRWDFGDIVYHPEELDIAKERREVIELRDEILDEVVQLYAERQRALLALAALPDRDSPEARKLALRADELGAGLDAWTGGWWGRRVPPLFSPRTSQEPNS